LLFPCAATIKDNDITANINVSTRFMIDFLNR